MFSKYIHKICSLEIFSLYIITKSIMILIKHFYYIIQQNNNNNNCKLCFDNKIMYKSTKQEMQIIDN